MSELAMLEIKAGDFQKAISTLKYASSTGDAEATFTLARIYYHGIGTKVDRNAAEYNLRKLEAPEAKMLLADLLCTEVGTDGYVEACSLYSELAGKGDNVAFYKLALVQQAMGKRDLASASFLAVIYSSTSSEQLKLKAQRSLSDMEAENAL